MQLQDITVNDKGKELTVEVAITNVVQTKGPTLFKITDGTGSFTVKAFSGAGKRSYPEFEEGSVVTVTFQVTEHRGSVEGEARNMQAAQDANAVRSAINERKRAASQITHDKFLVESVVTDKLKDRFLDAARVIKEAIADDRPILVRHHNDCDGYVSGVSLQRAILPLLEKRHDKKEANRYFVRSVCRAPFYSMEDAVRDVSITASNQERFGDKPPLVLVVDNGSTAQDLPAMQLGKTYGMEFLVIDHHAFGDTDVISDEVLVHINPFLVDEDYNFTAGMLCCELANILNKNVSDLYLLGATAGLADHTESSALDQFTAKAAEQGHDAEFLHKLGRTIDYFGFQLRNMESRELLGDLFGQNSTRQKKLVNIIVPLVNDLYDKAIALAKAHGVRKEIGKVHVQLLDVEKVFSRGDYPRPGLVVNKFHDFGETELGTVVSLCYGSDFVSIRASESSGFSVHDAIAFLERELPSSFAEGGGHANAGSVKFSAIMRDEVLTMLEKYVSSLN